MTCNSNNTTQVTTYPLVNSQPNCGDCGVSASVLYDKNVELMDKLNECSQEKEGLYQQLLEAQNIDLANVLSAEEGVQLTENTVGSSTQYIFSLDFSNLTAMSAF